MDFRRNYYFFKNNESLIIPIQLEQQQLNFKMQKKYKRALIGSIIGLLSLTLLLILLGLGRVSLDEYALNYSYIMASYSDPNVYGPGLYLIGIANKFVRIDKNQQNLYFSQLKTFSSDFYSVSANIQISYFMNFTTSSYEDLKNYVINFGVNPNTIFEPLIKNQILVILSSKDSSFYQTASGANAQLELEIKQKITSIFSIWNNATINVIIQSIVCSGTTTNTQILDRQIQSLINDLQRTSNEKIQMTEYFKSIQQQKLFQVSSTYASLQNKAFDLRRVLNQFKGSNPNLDGYNITKIIYNNKPLQYNINLVNILEQLAIIGNRTFPY